MGREPPNTLFLHLSFILLYHGNSYAITTASGHRPVVQYVLGVTSVIHLLHGMVSLFPSPKGKLKMDILIYANLVVYLNIHLSGLGKKPRHLKYSMEN